MVKSWKTIILLLFLVFLPLTSGASSLKQSFRAWTNVRFRDNLPNAPKWKYFIDTHLRFRTTDPVFERAIFRSAMGYRFENAPSVWLGYDYIPRQTLDEQIEQEQRFWQQAIFHLVDDPKFVLYLQSRFEQRDSLEESGIALRWRQKIIMTFPGFFANGVTPIITDGFYLNLNHVSWITKNLIDQNRLTIGIIIPCSKTFDVGIAYVNQYLVRNPRNIMNHAVYVSFLINLDKDDPDDSFGIED